MRSCDSSSPHLSRLRKFHLSGRSIDQSRKQEVLKLSLREDVTHLSFTDLSALHDPLSTVQAFISPQSAATSKLKVLELTGLRFADQSLVNYLTQTISACKHLQKLCLHFSNTMDLPFVLDLRPNSDLRVLDIQASELTSPSPETMESVCRTLRSISSPTIKRVTVRFERQGSSFTASRGVLQELDHALSSLYLRHLQHATSNASFAQYFPSLHSRGVHQGQVSPGSCSYDDATGRVAPLRSVSTAARNKFS
ncbi:hypothetical protein EIP91_000836 [Steccherinum ochraceum]|uniref:F-box domain-containing protein n=1 Tax=Steccherinum ochraceum TaxID=92696 RepID=A0A4R0RPZ0_9APHY|nr:hypothetical protein EIP91_000836 [Steccherinum ochraceum]